MPLADTYSKVSTILTQQEARDKARRQRESEQSIQDLYGSGQPVDEGSIQKLLASGADPASVLSISKLMRGDRVDNARVANIESQVRVRESPMVAGALKMPFDAWKAKPPEEQTQAEWEKWKATGRKLLASNRMDPDLVPVDADPAFIEAQIGAGYAPGQQDLTMDRQAEMGARQGRFEAGQAATQGRFEQSQAGLDQRSAATIGAANQRSSLNRTAADARTVQTGGGGGSPSVKQTQFDRDMSQLTPEEAKQALLLKYKLATPEPIPGTSEPIPGTPTKPLTEQQAKNAINVTSAEQAQMEMEKLKQEGFDPTTVLGAAQTYAAGIPVIGGMVSQGAQRQQAANTNFTASKGYLSSGSNVTQGEVDRIITGLLDRQGDRPEVSMYKKQARQAVIDAAKAGSPQVDTLVGSILQGLDNVEGRGTPSRSVQGQPAAPADDPNRQLTPEEMEEYMARTGGRR